MPKPLPSYWWDFHGPNYEVRVVRNTDSDYVVVSNTDEANKLIKDLEEGRKSWSKKYLW